MHSAMLEAENINSHNYTWQSCGLHLYVQPETLGSTYVLTAEKRDPY
jgi:hypothetical protein